MYLELMKEVRRISRVARNYLTIAIVVCIAEVLVMVGIILAIFLHSRDYARDHGAFAAAGFGAALFIIIFLLLPPVIILIVITVVAMRALLKVERAQSIDRAYVMLEMARSNTLGALILSLLMTNFIPMIFLGLAYLTVKKAKECALGRPPSARSRYRATPHSPPPYHGTSQGLNEDVPPPGVDYWEWKEKHGYWARKKRGEL